MSDVKLICFDLGRVLVKICDGWTHAVQIGKLPISLAPRGEVQMLALRDLTHRYEIDELTKQQFAEQAAVHFATEPRHVITMLDVYLLGLFDGVEELLIELNDHGYQTACLSNTNAQHWEKMFAGQCADYQPLAQIKHQFASQLIRRRKPDPGIYQHVEENLNLRGHQIVFFDDMPENIQAAKSRGWHGYVIHKNTNPVTQIRAHLAELGVLKPQMHADKRR